MFSILNKPKILFFCLCFSVLFWSETVKAQSKNATKTKKTRKKEKLSGNQNYLSLDVRDKDLHEIVAFVREQTGANIVMDPDISVRVTIALQNVPWLEALKVIVEQVNCELLKVTDNVWRVSQPPVVSIEFQDADIRKVILTIATVADINVVYGENIVGKVSVRLKDVPWREALEAILITTGNGYEMISEGKNFFHLQPATSVYFQAGGFSLPPENKLKLSMDFKEIPVRQAVYKIAELAKVNLICPDSIKGKVSIQLKEVSWEEALELILKAASSEYKLVRTKHVWLVRK